MLAVPWSTCAPTTGAGPSPPTRNPLNRRLGLVGAPPAWLLWELDADAMTGDNATA